MPHLRGYLNVTFFFTFSIPVFRSMIAIHKNFRSNERLALSTRNYVVHEQYRRVFQEGRSNETRHDRGRAVKNFEEKTSFVNSPIAVFSTHTRLLCRKQCKAHECTFIRALFHFRTTVNLAHLWSGCTFQGIRAIVAGFKRWRLINGRDCLGETFFYDIR